jgi:hypothetical protein
MYYAAQDLIEYLMNSVGGGAQDGEHRLLRAAASNAHREVMYARDWNWLATDAQLPTAVSGSNNKLFLLPANVKNVDALVAVERTKAMAYVTPREWRDIESKQLPTSNVVYWTVTASSTQPDRWMLKVAGTPSPIDNPSNFWITYRRAPPPLRRMGYEPSSRDGSLTAGTAAGCVKRYGTATNFPEGPSGVYPFVAEEILGLSGSLVGTPPENAKTVVSDFLDASESMYTAILSCAEVWVAKMMGKNVEGALSVYARDLRLAFEADNLTPMSGRRAGFGRYPESSGLSIGTARALGYYGPSGPDTGA